MRKVSIKVSPCSMKQTEEQKKICKERKRVLKLINNSCSFWNICNRKDAWKRVVVVVLKGSSCKMFYMLQHFKFSGLITSL